MLTPTLIDVASITDLRLTGNNFDPNEINKDPTNFDTDHASFGSYIKDYHVSGTTEVIAEEHIAFLTLWLSRCIFCYRSLKVAKRYLTLANQLHEGKYIFHSQLILGSLYESPGEATETLRNINPKDG